MPVFEAQGLRVYLSTSTSASTSSTALIGNMNAVTGPNSANADIDTTDLSSTAKTSLPSIIDNGVITLEGFLNTTDLGQINLRSAQPTRSIRKVTVAYNDDSSSIALCDGYINAYTPGGAVDGAVTLSVGIKVTGGVTYSTA